MANVPEFISILRKIRDDIYPAVLVSEQNVNADRVAVEAVAGTLPDIVAASDAAYVSAQASSASASSSATSAGQSAQSASSASASKDAAAQSALIATNKAAEIKGITAQATTGAPGSLASAIYNSTDGKFTFNIPQGVKGDKGEAFEVNAIGLIASRSNYDTQPAGFSFLASDDGNIYFKLTSTTADWSLGVPFGKGDTGDQGPIGIGIQSISFLSTTDISGLPAQQGATDTYRITYTDSNTFDYNIYNGTDNTVPSTDNAIVRFDGTTGQVQNSGVIIDDSNNVTGLGTINGRNISADGSKLDSIESGATADQTASEILTAIKTVDGAGSGLDADTVDGIQGGSIVQTTAVQALHSTDALRISGNRVYLYKGNGENEYVDIPSGLQDTAHNFATNGYQKLSNGLILQWGKRDTISTDETIPFNITFPTSCSNIQLSYYGSLQASIVSVSSNTNSSFTVDTSSTTQDYYWFAIGY